MHMYSRTGQQCVRQMNGQMDKQTYMYTYKHTCIHVHTNAQTYIHTYKCTCTYIIHTVYIQTKTDRQTDRPVRRE